MLAEGERVWYWRNRLENERWFWEVFFFDRLAVPALWTCAYMHVAPPHLLWCVAVPLLLIVWQNGGRAPPLLSFEVWLVLWLGVNKCRAQVAWLMGALLGGGGAGSAGGVFAFAG